VCVYIYVD